MTNTKTYRVLKAVPYFEEGAILKRDGSTYTAIENIWDTEAAVEATKNGQTPKLTQYEVEYSPEFFELVYETSKLGKVIYQTKDAAKAEYAKLFKK